MNVLDELEIRDVFFGEGNTGKSYVVLCNDEKSSLPISSVFQDALKAGSTTASFRLLDCNHVLPESGKTIAERFSLDLKIRPTIFISGATVAEPTQIPEQHLKSGKVLAKVLRSKLEPHAAKIETTQDLKTKCLDKDICGLLLKGTKKAPQYLKDAMQNLLKEFPKVAFASIDSTVLYVKNLEDQLPELSDGQPRFVVFKKVSGSSTDKEKGRLITSIAPLPTNGVSYGQLSNLIAGVVQNTQSMQRIPMLPSVKLRTKKLEQEEKKKRERKASRDRGDDEGSSGTAEANDGSTEGRRLERERRRAEHRKKNVSRPRCLLKPKRSHNVYRWYEKELLKRLLKWNASVVSVWRKKRNVGTWTQTTCQNPGSLSGMNCMKKMTTLMRKTKEMMRMMKT